MLNDSKHYLVRRLPGPSLIFGHQANVKREAAAARISVRSVSCPGTTMPAASAGVFPPNALCGRRKLWNMT